MRLHEVVHQAKNSRRFRRRGGERWFWAQDPVPAGVTFADAAAEDWELERPASAFTESDFWEAVREVHTSDERRTLGSVNVPFNFAALADKLFNK